MQLDDGPELGEEMQSSSPVQKFDSKWLEEQKFYIQYHKPFVLELSCELTPVFYGWARLILTTAASSTTKACRVFYAEILSSQFSDVGAYPLMRRWMDSGMEPIFLSIQYRMYHVISLNIYRHPNSAMSAPTHQ